MNSYRLAITEAFAEVVALKHARHRAAGGQLDHIGTGLARHPFGIKYDPGFLRVEDLEYLLLVGFRILMHLGLRQWRPGCALAGRITDHAGKIADQEQHLVTKVLELFEFIN